MKENTTTNAAAIKAETTNFDFDFLIRIVESAGIVAQGEMQFLPPGDGRHTPSLLKLTIQALSATNKYGQVVHK
jgi:hypothetical protein